MVVEKQTFKRETFKKFQKYKILNKANTILRKHGCSTPCEFVHVQLTLAGNLYFTNHHIKREEQLAPYFQKLAKDFSENFKVLEVSGIGE
jgi:Na+/melibiose symporter-like transporter